MEVWERSKDTPSVQQQQKNHHPDTSHVPVSVAAAFLCIAIVNAASVACPGRGVLTLLCLPQDDFNLWPMTSTVCLSYQDFDLAQSQGFDSQIPVTLVWHKDFWCPHFRWQPYPKPTETKQSFRFLSCCVLNQRPKGGVLVQGDAVPRSLPSLASPRGNQQASNLVFRFWQNLEAQEPKELNAAAHYEKCNNLWCSFKALLGSDQTCWRPSICLSLTQTLTQGRPANTSSTLGSLIKQANSPKWRLSSKGMYFMVWALLKLTPWLPQSFQYRPYSCRSTDIRLLKPSRQDRY